jgi:hypothetical protein
MTTTDPTLLGGGGAIVAVAAIGAISAILVAWIGRPIRKERERLSRIEENTSKTGNGWTESLDRRLDQMERSITGRLDHLGHQVGRVEGRLDEHLRFPEQRKEDDDDGQAVVPGR